MQEIAYDHRVHVNLLHYSHRTAAPDARRCNLDLRMASGRRMDEDRYNAIEPGDRKAYWDDFVRVFGPYLDGSLFAKGHRGPIPAPGFYLTFHESWPLPVRAYFDGNPDAYEAFRDHPEYAETFVAILRDFLRVAEREGWTGAGFQLYLNNKGSLDDPSRAPWILDEPTSWFDYRALAYYGDLVRRAKEEGTPVRVDYRIDVSRPQFDRGELRGKADLWVVATAAFRAYRRIVLDRAERTGERIWLYGSSSGVGESSRRIHAWVLGAFADGAGGVVPWQTIDRTGQAMERGDALALFVFDRGAIRPSLRLKAYRRAEQDVAYLARVRRRLGLPDSVLRAWIRSFVPAGRVPGPEAFRRLRAAAAALAD